ncbi:RadC family protein [uncultured Lactobacillus sp.]|uniref:JAB domain-containing protein n=1 Tax=uncultured Lactobacillus sp. TaxID=153152 RepID=UPI0026179445|nr:JAB domain-containing protein [uncultured Lactobacillus sp.]
MKNNIKNIAEAKAVPEMSRTELLSVIKEDLVSKGITTLDYLFNDLNENVLFDSLSPVAQHAYVKFLADELSDKSDKFMKFTSSVELGTYLANKYSNLEHEELHVISVDIHNRVLADDCITVGSIDRSIAVPRDVFRSAIMNNAAGFFIMHNHPSCDLQPSRNDIHFTESISSLAKTMNINFLDHFIVGGGSYLSLRENMIL